MTCESIEDAAVKYMAALKKLTGKVPRPKTDLCAQVIVMELYLKLAYVLLELETCCPEAIS